MYNKKIRKIFAACALATALTMAAGSISVSAADTPAAGSKTGINPIAVDNPDTGDVDEAYSDTEISVWGYSKDATIYSVDVEWGVMTFEYEASSWDPATHKKADGAGWQVYDSTANKALTGTQHDINKVTITNHSNASVYAALSYADAGTTNVTGKFADTETASDNVKAVWTDTDTTNHSTGYFTLATASTDASGGAVTDGAEGAPSKGNAYFIPNGTPSGTPITSLTTIGKINVAISTEVPTP